MKKILLVFVYFSSLNLGIAQPDRWQQAIDYQMEVDFDVKKHQYTGTQKITYFNNSPDTLNRVFYHLYFNAFQPNSQMDIRSRNIVDPDRRVGDRISKLSEEEIGYLRPTSLTQDGQILTYEIVETILEVELANPILPNSSVVFEMEFEGQIPKQIRRSGRNNAEGIDYTMTQWYPKMANYDYEGWHANPYIGREFYGIWGDFDVKIAIDKDYVVAATGILQNPEQIGYGYEAEGQSVKKEVTKGKLNWHFKAEKVHDFAWGADPDFLHDIMEINNGTKLHFFYQDSVRGVWQEMQPYAVQAFEVMNEKFGEYPYETYSFVQGGDGGMEYPMLTMITGERTLESLVGVAVHEAIHSWYQMVLGTNESKYPWMDEGYTTYAQGYVESVLFNQNAANAHTGNYRNHDYVVSEKIIEPLTTHSDHYKTNTAYGVNSYSRGAIFLHQLSYIIGEENLDKGMRIYYDTWKFKHPNPNDFKRIMEKQSGLELDWYLEHWIGTVNAIDYGIKSATDEEGKTKVILERKQPMPMPIDLLVTYTDGSQEVYYIPLQIMRGEKPDSDFAVTKIKAEDWGWTSPTYELMLEKPLSDIQKMEIDPSGRMADINKGNNTFKN